MQTPKTYLLLLSDSQTEKTLQCLASLQCIFQPKFQILVIERGSTERSRRAIRRIYPKMPILALDQNLSRGEGFNQAISWALSKKAEWIFLLDSNIQVFPDVLEQLMAAAKGLPERIILGAKIYRSENGIEQVGQMWDPKKGRFVFLRDDQEKAESVDAVSSSALFMHRSVIETIGLFEPKFSSSWQDGDFCTRAKKRGLEIWTAPQAKVQRQETPLDLDSFSWWKERLLWMKRNCPFQERKRLYRQVVFPELLRYVQKYFKSIVKSMVA